MTIKKSILVIALVIISSLHFLRRSEASPVDSLTQFIEEELTTLDAAVQSSPTESLITSTTDDEMYFFRRFWFRFRGRVERDIPGLAGFAIVPEIEMLWEKQLPEGWETYKIVKK